MKGIYKILKIKYRGKLTDFEFESVLGTAVTKTPCSSCGMDRCYQMEAERFRCCNPLCAAGCVGLRTNQCHVSVCRI